MCDSFCEALGGSNAVFLFFQSADVAPESVSDGDRTSHPLLTLGRRSPSDVIYRVAP